MRPVGRTICSAMRLLVRSSYSPGVADMNTIWSTFLMNSSNRSGRLSSALGSRNPNSTSVSLRVLSPSYIPWICGTVTCDSSRTEEHTSELQSPDHLVCRLLLEKKKKNKTKHSPKKKKKKKKKNT